MTSYDALEDPIAIRELAIERWDALVQHVRRITFLAGEVIRLGERETRLTGATFGSPLADERATHLFIPQGGASTFSQLPEVAGAYLRALQGVYLPGPPPLFLEDSASPTRQYPLTRETLSPAASEQSGPGSAAGLSATGSRAGTPPVPEVPLPKSPRDGASPQEDSAMLDA